MTNGMELKGKHSLGYNLSVPNVVIKALFSISCFLLYIFFSQTEDFHVGQNLSKECSKSLSLEHN